MHWSLIPVALICLYMALRTPSSVAMSLWFLITLIALVTWVWLRYRLLFGTQRRELQITPLDRAEIERIKQQAAIGNAASTEQPAAVIAAPPAPAPQPPPGPAERPTTGRAVFVLPDDPPQVSGPQPGLER